MDILLALRTFYVAQIPPFLIAYCIPDLRERFVAYGARGSSSIPTSRERNSNSERTSPEKPVPRSSTTRGTLNFLLSLTNIRVPHAWFIQFYVVSVVSSWVWLHQLLTRGPLFLAVSRMTPEQPVSMTVNQILVCWCLMTLQGSRRLYECSTPTKTSQSTMWVFIWGDGILFYLAMSLSIWIEGIPALLSTDVYFEGITPSAPTIRTIICVAIFLIASGIQHTCHAHLATLEKYTVPMHPAFAKIVSPHYTAECAIYLALTFLAAPEGHLVNKTMLSASVFVVANLCISAQISRTWSIEKFGEDSVKGKWRILPGVW